MRYLVEVSRDGARQLQWMRGKSRGPYSQRFVERFRPVVMYGNLTPGADKLYGQTGTIRCAARRLEEA